MYVGVRVEGRGRGWANDLRRACKKKRCANFWGGCFLHRPRVFALAPRGRDAPGVFALAVPVFAPAPRGQGAGVCIGTRGGVPVFALAVPVFAPVFAPAPRGQGRVFALALRGPCTLAPAGPCAPPPKPRRRSNPNTRWEGWGPHSAGASNPSTRCGRGDGAPHSHTAKGVGAGGAGSKRTV